MTQLPKQLCDFMEWQRAETFQPIAGPRKPWAVRYTTPKGTFQTTERPKGTTEALLDGIRAAMHVELSRREDAKRKATEGLASFTNEEIQAEVLRRLGANAKYQSEVEWDQAEFHKAFWDYMEPSTDELAKCLKDNSDITARDVFPDQIDDIEAEARANGDLVRPAATVAWAEGSELVAAIRDLRHVLTVEYGAGNKLAARLL